MSVLSSMGEKLGRFSFIYSGSTPGWDELEATRDNSARILQVIRARWVALAMLCGYGLFIYLLYRHDPEVELSYWQQVYPLAALIFVAMYNAWYHLTYTWWARFRFTNNLQIALDMLVITLLVHLSGGVHSWFWAMYLLLSLEAAVLLPRRLEVWLVWGLSAVLHAGLLTAEFHGSVGTAAMPFTDPQLHSSGSYAMIVWGWAATVNAAVVWVATYLTGALREREASLAALCVRDRQTGLYNRACFYQRLESELARCERFDRTLALVLLDVDEFVPLNERHGHDIGDCVLEALVGLLEASLRAGSTRRRAEVDLLFRHGGDEFAILMPEASLADASAAAERLRALIAGTLRREAASQCAMRGLEVELATLHITASFGVSAHPEHGSSPDLLVRAAKEALIRARAAGHNRVEQALAPRI